MTYLLKNALLLDAEHDHAPLDILIDGETIAAVGTDLGSADRIRISPNSSPACRIWLNSMLLWKISSP